MTGLEIGFECYPKTFLKWLHHTLTVFNVYFGKNIQCIFTVYLCFPIQVFRAGQKVPFLCVSYVLTAGSQQVSLGANCPQILA